MIRSELVQAVGAANTHLTQADVERVVATIFEQITAALATRRRVELRGFGTFSTRARDARIGRNPLTGRAVLVAAKQDPFFKPGKMLRDRIKLV